MDAASTVVIKFKYGDVLRRCNAQIVDDQLHVSINELKEKALSLFGLARETEIMLTYIDEDGDMVALVDADDFRDVVKQGLNPVRIIVKVVSENNAGRLTKSNLSSVESISIKSPQVQKDLLPSGFLRNFPEPLRQVLLSYESHTSDKLCASGDVREESPAQTITNDTCIPMFNDSVANRNIGENPDSSCILTEKVVNNVPKTKNYTASDAKKDYIDRPVVPRKHMPYKNKGYWDIHEPNMSYLEIMVQQTSMSKLGSCLCPMKCTFQEPNMSYLETMVQQTSMSKLGSCLIEDVTLKTDTIMGPLTQFTKIWRMRNCGETAWPEKTRLVCASRGGFNRYSVELEIPAGGVPVGGDLDVAVDLVAPAVPGRYISFWSMASPGLLFGPRVSVLVQVDASIETGIITANVEPEPKPYNPIAVGNLEKLKEVKELQHRSSAKTWGGKVHQSNANFWEPVPNPTSTITPYLPPPLSLLSPKSYEEQLKLMQKNIQTQLQRLEDLQQMQHRAIKTFGQTKLELAHQANAQLWGIAPTKLETLASLISQRYLELMDRQEHMQILMQEMQLQLILEQQQQQRELSNEQQREVSKVAAKPSSDFGVDAFIEAGTITANVKPVGVSQPGPNNQTKVDASIEAGTITANVKPVGVSQPGPNNQTKVRAPAPTIATPSPVLSTSQGYHELLDTAKTYVRQALLANKQFSASATVHQANTQNEVAPTPVPAPTSSIAPTSTTTLMDSLENLKQSQMQRQRPYRRMQEQQKHQQRANRTCSQTQLEQNLLNHPYFDHYTNGLVREPEVGPDAEAGPYRRMQEKQKHQQRANRTCSQTQLEQNLLNHPYFDHYTNGLVREPEAEPDAEAGPYRRMQEQQKHQQRANRTCSQTQLEQAHQANTPSWDEVVVTPTIPPIPFTSFTPQQQSQLLKRVQMQKELSERVAEPSLDEWSHPFDNEWANPLD